MKNSIIKNHLINHNKGDLASLPSTGDWERIEKAAKLAAENCQRVDEMTVRELTELLRKVQEMEMEEAVKRAEKQLKLV